MNPDPLPFLQICKSASQPEDRPRLRDVRALAPFVFGFVAIAGENGEPLDPHTNR